MVQLLLLSLIPRLLKSNPPPSLELSGKRRMEVAPIKDTEVTDVMLSTSDHRCLHGQQGRCHHSAPEDRQGDEKISTKQTGLGGKPSKMEPSAPHAAQRGQREPFQPHPGMATFLLMTPASRQAHSHHDSLTARNAACKMSWNHILRQVLVISCHPGITASMGKALTPRETRQVMETQREQCKGQSGGLTTKKGGICFLSPALC